MEYRLRHLHLGVDTQRLWKAEIEGRSRYDDSRVVHLTRRRRASTAGWSRFGGGGVREKGRSVGDTAVAVEAAATGSSRGKGEEF